MAAMPLLGLLWLGTIGTLASFGLFIDFGDGGKTQAVITFAGTLVWATFSISAFSVTAESMTTPAPIWPFIWVGAGFAAVLFIFCLWQLLGASMSEVDGGASELQP